MSYRALLGLDTVKGKSGDVAVSSLEGKMLMLYFSAHWCPPCRGFTPKLAEFYKHLEGRAEILFVSSDKDQHSFDEYYAEHPWLAVPFDRRDVKGALSKTFKVEGIPTLVVLEPSGKVLTKNGREIVDTDPNAKNFPWADMNAGVFDILGTAPIRTKSGTMTAADLRKPGSFFAIYFSAHWCPPCRGFTPKFVETYNKLVAKGKPFTVIFASSDRDQHSFDEYYNEMPWATLPFGDSRKEKLSSRFEVSGIPTVIVFDHKGDIVNEKARGAIGGDPEGEQFPWAPQPMPKVAKMNADDDVIEALNEKVCVLMLGEGGAALSEYTAAGNANTNDDVQYLVPADKEFLGRVAGHINVEVSVSEPTVVAFNVSNGKAKDVMKGPITKDAVAVFVNKFVASQK